MFCAISGSTPTEPVISPAGHLFEKSLVTKALKVRGSADRPSPLPARDRGRSVDFRRAEGFFEAPVRTFFPPTESSSAARAPPPAADVRSETRKRRTGDGLVPGDERAFVRG